jgi:AraC family transcriptional regulator
VSDEIRNQPEIKSLLISESPRLEIMWLQAKRGQTSSLLLKNHSYAAVTRPATSRRSVNSDPWEDVEWPGTSVGFMPADWRLDAEITSDYEATSLIMDDSFFMDAANENLDYRPGQFRPIAAGISPIGNALISSIRGLIHPNEIGQWPLLVENVASALASHLMQLFSAKPGNKDPYPFGLPRERMRRVIDFIEANIHRDIHLNELASVAALSTFHFSRSFKQAMGITPVRYVWTRRIERAKALLNNREVPLAIIALDCGFSSQSHFTTAFRRETGVTPAQYRAKL